MKEKGNKIKYKGSAAIDVAIIGNAIAHFFANFNEFKNENLENKLKIYTYSSIPLAYMFGNKLISIILFIKNTCVGIIILKGFLIINNILDMIRNVFGCFFSESFILGEKF